MVCAYSVTTSVLYRHRKLNQVQVYTIYVKRSSPEQGSQEYDLAHIDCEYAVRVRRISERVVVRSSDIRIPSEIELQ